MGEQAAWRAPGSSELLLQAGTLQTSGDKGGGSEELGRGTWSRRYHRAMREDWGLEKEGEEKFITPDKEVMI